jgi:hypothetical protein
MVTYLLYRLAQSQVFPRSFCIDNVVPCPTDNMPDYGGSGTVVRGYHDGRVVAIKELRYDEDAQKVSQLGFGPVSISHSGQGIQQGSYAMASAQAPEHSTISWDLGTQRCWSEAIHDLGLHDQSLSLLLHPQIKQICSRSTSLSVGTSTTVLLCEQPFHLERW